MNQLQKGLFTLSAAALLVLSAGAQAHGNYKGEAAVMPAPCPTIQVLHDGFYVGAGVGYDMYRIGKQVSVADGDGDSISSSRHASGAGWVGGIFGGYGMYFDRFYLAAELLGNWSGASAGGNDSINNADGSFIATSSNVDVRETYGISILPGIKVNDATLAYVRLGYNRTKFNPSETVTTDDTAAITTSNSNTRGGFNYGVGLETVVWQNISVRGEYTRTNYSSFNTSIGTTYKISDNQVMAGVIFHFA